MEFSYDYWSRSWWGQTDQMAASITREEQGELHLERYVVELFDLPRTTRWEQGDYVETGETRTFIGLENAKKWARAKNHALTAIAMFAEVEVDEADLAQSEEQAIEEDRMNEYLDLIIEKFPEIMETVQTRPETVRSSTNTNQRSNS